MNTAHVRFRFLCLMLALIASTLATGGFAQTPSSSPAVSVDPALPVYKPRTILHGRLRTVGSDTMDDLLRRWGAGLQQYHPKLTLFCEGKGSSTALPNLIKGISDFGPMSRTIKDEEITRFESKYGYPPVQLKVALDSVAIFVHGDNPIVGKGLTLTQLDAIFSSTRRAGGPRDITTWGDLGLTGDWGSARINVYSRNTASGTYTFFREHVLKNGDFKTTNHELVGSAAVVSSVAADRYGIGFSGIGYKTEQVATVPLANTDSKFISTDPRFCYDGEYPLSRFLYLTLNYKPTSPLSPLQEEVLRFVYSQQGQSLVVEEGFYPLTAQIAREERARVGIH